MMKEVDVQAILAQLSTEEKVALLHGTGMDIAVNIGSIKGRVPGAGGETFAIDRLGVPATILCDGPAGVRIDATRPDTDKTFYTTAFPCESALASTWDRDLAFKMGQAMGNESLEDG
ncbi:hypothetical protein [Paenalcaligenes faecalis]|uniref:hypothetical protein n=1 Tax=Paenalcaligenes faecalis TaxID=2980099 RepID=UPI0022B98A27|nr:hypothetical protein [Paenalcaligenes faecalis]